MAQADEIAREDAAAAAVRRAHAREKIEAEAKKQASERKRLENIRHFENEVSYAKQELKLAEQTKPTTGFGFGFGTVTQQTIDAEKSVVLKKLNFLEERLKEALAVPSFLDKPAPQARAPTDYVKVATADTNVLTQKQPNEILVEQLEALWFKKELFMRPSPIVADIEDLIRTALAKQQECVSTDDVKLILMRYDTV
jgi:hypothetical protein